MKAGFDCTITYEEAEKITTQVLEDSIEGLTLSTFQWFSVDADEDKKCIEAMRHHLAMVLTYFSVGDYPLNLAEELKKEVANGAASVSNQRCDAGCGGD